MMDIDGATPGSEPRQRQRRIKVGERAIYKADTSKSIGGSKIGGGERGDMEAEAFRRREIEDI